MQWIFLKVSTDRNIFTDEWVQSAFRLPVGGRRRSHRKWNNGPYVPHWPVRPDRPIIPFPELHSASKPRGQFLKDFATSHSQKNFTVNATSQNLSEMGLSSPYQNTLDSIAFTGLSKRNGAKLRESFCPAAASHSRPCQASA